MKPPLMFNEFTLSVSEMLLMFDDIILKVNEAHFMVLITKGSRTAKPL